MAIGSLGYSLAVSTSAVIELLETKSSASDVQINSPCAIAIPALRARPSDPGRSPPIEAFPEPIPGGQSYAIRWGQS